MAGEGRCVTLAPGPQPPSPEGEGGWGLPFYVK